LLDSCSLFTGGGTLPAKCLPQREMFHNAGLTCAEHRKLAIYTECTLVISLLMFTDSANNNKNQYINKQVHQQHTHPPYCLTAVVSALEALFATMRYINLHLHLHIACVQLKLCATLSPPFSRDGNNARWCIKIVIVDECLVHHCWK